MTTTHEKKIYSQHGEDGIIEFIASKLKNPRKTFLEIGYSAGGQNNSLNLSKNHGWSGVGFDYRRQVVEPPVNVKVFTKWLDMNSIAEILLHSGTDVDFYSVDIDSIDFWLTVGLMDNGFNPSFACVELLNSAGEEVSIAPPVNVENFRYNKFHACGASITAWKRFWKNRGYEFLTVDSSGINAFFYRPELFSTDIIEYPAISFVKSKKHIPYNEWLTYFTRNVNIERCLITGNETLQDLKLHEK